MLHQLVIGPVVTIPAGSQETITSSLWTGPKLQKKIKWQLSQNNLDLTVDYGWAWFIAKTVILVINLYSRDCI